MSNTPNCDLERLVSGQGSGEVTHNSAINKIDALLMGGIKDRHLTAPPGSPAEGDRYIVAAGGSGAWSGYDGYMAIYYSGWVFLAPAEGWLLWVDDENVFIRYDSAAWAILASQQAAVVAALTDSSGGTPGATLAAMTNTDTVTDSTGGAADDTVDSVALAGDPNGAAADGTLVTVTDPSDSPADADALRDDLVTNTIANLRDNQEEFQAALGKANNNFKEICDQLATQKTFNGTTADSLASLCSKVNAILTALKNANIMASS